MQISYISQSQVQTEHQKKGDLNDFECGVVVGARQAGSVKTVQNSRRVSSKRWWAGCDESFMMFVTFWMQREVKIRSRTGRCVCVILSAVLITLCRAFCQPQSCCRTTTADKSAATVMLSHQNLWGYFSSTFLDLCYEGLRKFWRQPSVSKYLINWPVSLYGHFLLLLLSLKSQRFVNHCINQFGSHLNYH